ncbi:MAG: DMT family transporter [Betaproteobacteria bacterium]
MQLVLASLAAFCFTLGGVFMKHAEGLRNATPTALFLLLFGVGAAVQSLAMRGAELTTTYLIVLGLEAALAVAFGMLLFAEPMTVRKLCAIVLIVGGIALLRTA